jgi:hypothetical protein
MVKLDNSFTMLADFCALYDGLTDFTFLFQAIISLIAKTITPINTKGISIIPMNIAAAKPHANKRSVRNEKHSSQILFFISFFDLQHQTIFLLYQHWFS